jgi:hypothetical protein
VDVEIRDDERLGGASRALGCEAQDSGRVGSDWLSVVV